MTALAAPLVARTYGKFRFIAPEVLTTGRARYPHGTWVVDAEPAVKMRLKRSFARVQGARNGNLVFGHSVEVARDLEWFMERYPLLPFDDDSAAMLATSAAEHRATEQAIADILTGGHRSALPLQPAKKPRDYQLAAVELLRTTGGLLLTDEVGLGKTLTGLLNLVHDDALPAVIVPPTHLPPRWIAELDESMPWLRHHLVKKGTPYPLTDKQGRDPDVIIIPYSKLAGWADHLAGKVQTLVFDEVQDLRNGVGTEKGRAAARLADTVRYRLGLTATPVYNYAGESWNIMNILAPGTLGSKDEFSREWGASTFGNGHIRVADPAALGGYLREQGVMLGRTRKDVGRELPKTVKVEQHVASDPAALEKVAGDARAMAELVLSQNAQRFDRFQAAGQLDMLVRQATGIGKAPYVAEFVRMLLESESKVVLFGWHRAVYDIWLERLAEYRPVLYTGSESPTQKQAALEAFMSEEVDASRVLVMSLRSGAGVDGLQKACRVSVFGELDWSPQVHEQAIGRLRRDGMGEDPPVAYFLVSDHGSDPTIAEVLQVKRQQGEQLVTPDGKLFENAVADAGRAKMLAESVLAGRR